MSTSALEGCFTLGSKGEAFRRLERKKKASPALQQPSKSKHDHQTFPDLGPHSHPFTHSHQPFQKANKMTTQSPPWNRGVSQPQRMLLDAGYCLMASDCTIVYHSVPWCNWGPERSRKTTIAQGTCSSHSGMRAEQTEWAFLFGAPPLKRL